MLNAAVPYQVRRNLFWSNTASVSGAVAWETRGGTIEANTFHDNSHTAPLGGSTILFQHPLTDVVYVKNNIVSGSGGAPAMALLSSTTGQPVSSCNDFWNNVDGDFLRYQPGPTDVFVDPEYCDAAAGDFTLHQSSPCLPPNSGACGQVGKYGQNCGSVSVEADSWGGIKSGYRGAQKGGE
jgi:hypothetical protein